MTCQDKLQKSLKEEKNKFDNIEAPEELEPRLRSALNERKRKKPQRSLSLIASLVIVLMLFTYNFDAIAFYSKKILGFEGIIQGTLKDLNEMGKGQGIDKSYVFKNGVKLTLDGIMVDENRLITFFTLRDEKKRLDEISLSSLSMKGLLKEYNGNNGFGNTNDSLTEQKWIFNFDPPDFYERNIEFNFTLSEGNFREEGTIKFKLDRNKAMGYRIKQEIDKTLKTNGAEIHINTIIASPTLTVIKGTIEEEPELSRLTNGFNGFQEHIKLELFADGKKVAHGGGGRGGVGGKFSFEERFEALPQDVKKLEIKVTKLPVFENASKKVAINDSITELPVTVAGKVILIKKVWFENDSTFITLVSKINVKPRDIFLISDGNRVKSEKTVSEEMIKDRKQGIQRKWTLKFKGVGVEEWKKIERLEISGIAFLKEVDETIEISVSKNKDD